MTLWRSRKIAVQLLWGSSLSFITCKMQTNNKEVSYNKGLGWDAIVIGGRQAGLALGYHLQKKDLQFLILEANNQALGLYLSIMTA